LVISKSVSINPQTNCHVMPYIYQSAGMNPSFKNVRVEDDDQAKVIKELSDVSQQNAAEKR